MTTTTFWRDRRVFVTGHTGFKGAWLCLWLSRLGAKVSGYALAPECHETLFSAANLECRINSTIGDVRDQDRLNRAIEKAQPEIVFHLAAQALVRRGYADPVGTFDVNVIGTAKLLEALRHAPSIQATVVATSDKVYENREWTWGYREIDGLGGHDPYGASKAASEMVVTAFRGMPPASRQAIATARAGNVVGGGDWAEDRLVPDCIRALRNNLPPRLRHPGSTRPWQHVLDALAGYLILAERLTSDAASASEAWNFGPSADGVIEVAAFARHISELWSGPPPVENPHPAGGHEARALLLDAGKARAKLGWAPKLALAETLAWTVEWYQRRHDGDDALDLTLDQIGRYEALAAT